MTEADPPLNASDPSPPRPTVQNLIAAYRAARIYQRATLQAERRAERAALRRQRLNRRGLAKPPQPKPPEAAPHQPPPEALTLSAIGFGPGMVIRFRQLGIVTAADLAASDPATLRTALGDITRLINVNDWIATAQKAIAA